TAFRGAGRDLHAQDAAQWEHAASAVRPDDEVLRQVDAMVTLCPGEIRDVQLSVLPLSKPIERCFTIYRPMLVDAVVNFGEGPANRLDSLRQAAPNVVLATTEILEELHTTIEGAIANAMKLDRAAYRIALGAGAAAADRRARGLPLSLALKVRCFFARL